MRIERYEKESWKKMSESAHQICFSEKRPIGMDRIDFALLAVTDGGSPAGYITCRETDKDTVYWQFGGAFPSVKGTVSSYRAYEDFVNWTKTRYERIYTLIENTNSPMLRMAANIGFLIVGVKCFHGQILLEHLLEFENGNSTDVR